MEKVRLLWADDEIDLLKPHILLLEQKGYNVTAVKSGTEAIDEIKENVFDVVFLDENMPGLTGLETLAELKKIKSDLPVVMITKSEEEYVMDDAIGSQIADYLIKPVNPKQIWLSVKKIIDKKRLVSEKVSSTYQQDFRELSMRLNDRLDIFEWIQLYQDLVYWELQLDKSDEESMQEILQTQKAEANNNFAKIVEDEYEEWVNNLDEAPVLSCNVFARKVAPVLKESEKPTMLIVLDNLRFDQYKSLTSRLREMYRIDEESAYLSILPTATQYARNSFFAGLMPSEIAKRFPKLWKNDEDEGGKNMHEEEFLADLIQRLGLSKSFAYHKIVKLEAGRILVDNIQNTLKNNDLTVVVYNFIDTLSHARTDMEVIKELAEDEAAYRSLTLSWFDHSPILDILKKAAQQDINLIITTDHGSQRVKKGVKVVGDRNTTTNLRYKQGKSLKYNAKQVVEFRNPERIKLPKSNLSSTYIFSKPEDFFVYPNNQHYYENFYRDTFQHGGISLEEMVIPFIKLSTKK